MKTILVVFAFAACLSVAGYAQSQETKEKAEVKKKVDFCAVPETKTLPGGAPIESAGALTKETEIKEAGSTVAETKSEEKLKEINKEKPKGCCSGKDQKKDE